MFDDKRMTLFLRTCFPIAIVLVCLLMGIGYATVNNVSLDIKGVLAAETQKGVFITDIQYKSS